MLTPLLILFLSINTNAQTFELNGKDTLNYVDVNGRKQGKWVLYGKHKPNTCYSINQKAEEGSYKENRKTGLWLEYYCNNNVKSKVNFNNGRADGHAVLYFENGKVQEEGEWKGNKWVGALKQYYDNGQVQHEFNYSQTGKREGEQVYHYENGQVAVKGNFTNGKETGVINEYYENGDKKAEKTFNNGDVDVASIKTFDAKKELPKHTEIVKQETTVKTTVSKDETLATVGKAPTVLNGHHVLYNKDKQVTKDGDFVNNVLMSGKAFIYNENGILTRVAIYKNGIYQGDGVIEK
ncbi:MAG: toxin-antitoxin system YwqK family antitoxin [Bacteroidetes bacterium]|nr:toxin-antitoxin system YwqK family antitoxin [Bacteroidota bacterium]